MFWGAISDFGPLSVLIGGHRRDLSGTTLRNRWVEWRLGGRPRKGFEPALVGTGAKSHASTAEVYEIFAEWAIFSVRAQGNLCAGGGILKTRTRTGHLGAFPRNGVRPRRTTALQRCPLADARQGRTTNAMLKHRGGVLTPRPPLSRRCPAAIPLCPSGFACASLGGLAEVHQESVSTQAARLCGTGPGTARSVVSSLGVLAVAHGYAVELPPTIWPRGACNAARPITREGP